MMCGRRKVEEEKSRSYERVEKYYGESLERKRCREDLLRLFTLRLILHRRALHLLRDKYTVFREAMTMEAHKWSHVPRDVCKEEMAESETARVKSRGSE